MAKNYRRFYALFRQLDIRGDREDCRKQLILQYTCGRTDSLREMADKEYEALCGALRKLIGDREELRKKRSICLKLMQELGVETYRWEDVDRYCSQPRIAGKRFAWLSIDELTALARKLRAIKSKIEN